MPIEAKKLEKPLHLFLGMASPAVSQLFSVVIILNLWWTDLSAVRDVVKIRKEGIRCTIPVLKETDHSRINLADILISRFSLTLGWPVFINFFFNSFKLSVFNSSYLPRPSPLKRFPSKDFVSGSIFLFFSYPAQKAVPRLFSSFFKASVLNLWILVTFYCISLTVSATSSWSCLCVTSLSSFLLPPHCPSSASWERDSDTSHQGSWTLFLLWSWLFLSSTCSGLSGFLSG